MVSPIVFDASALAALLFQEPGSEALVPLLPEAALSAAALADVHACLVLRGAGEEFAWTRLASLACEVLPFTAEQARTAGSLALRARHLPLGARASIALAIERHATLYTTDPSCRNLAPNLRVVVLD